MAVLHYACIHVVTDSKGGVSQIYVFYHACNAYGVKRALNMLLYGRLSLPGDGFKTCLAATDFLEVDAHRTGRGNRPNLMHVPKLPAINTCPGHTEGQGGNSFGAFQQVHVPHDLPVCQPPPPFNL